MQSTVAKRYAQALFELARDKKLELEPQMAAVAAIWNAEPLLSRVLTDPRWPVERKKSVLHSLAEQLNLDTYLLNTLNLLLDKGRIGHLPAVAAQYRILDDLHNRRIRAQCRSATALDEQQQEQLKAKLASLTGAREIELSVVIDPDLVAGFVVNIEGKIIDGSLKGRLERMGRKLAQPSHGS